MIGVLITVFIFAALALIMGSKMRGAVHDNRLSWYHTALKKPWGVPPDWVFRVVWPILYVFIGYVGYEIFATPHLHHLRLLFVVQLVLNLAWSPLFFYYHRLRLALVDSILLAMSVYVLKTELSLQGACFSSVLMTLYLGWLLFAAYLSAGYVVLN